VVESSQTDAGGELQVVAPHVGPTQAEPVQPPSQKWSMWRYEQAPPRHVPTGSNTRSVLAPTQVFAGAVRQFTVAHGFPVSGVPGW
jgi:hypothetical protein